MNTRLTSLAMVLSLSMGLGVIVTGCDRNTPVTAVPPVSVGVALDDTVMTTKVKTALLGDESIKGFDIKVVTRKGTVQLSGFVDNQTQLDRAVYVAHGVEGVTAVENNMTLKEGKAATVGNTLDDSIITTRVKTVLLADPDVKGVEIGVVTRKGEVQLSGFVGSQGQIDRAVALAQVVEGVQSVVNQMSVKK
ncbi:BON domain-containing protein [Candidatus Aalborgicola defluviihabitans]|uniref:BON domain-containing protein n=1 Tax=Candidatus Aalborgicola defluviihabitans TaxID=3386187 RepID=UPI001ECCF312|nr:BON domain-containing protein [Burkholderiales bacterium]